MKKEKFISEHKYPTPSGWGYIYRKNSPAGMPRRRAARQFLSEIKALWKPFVAVFLICFLIINWGSVSWIFNYKVVSQFFSGFFQKNSSQSVNAVSSELLKKENNLEIPKLNISAPLILAKDESQVKWDLDRGVVLYPKSALPGEPGQTIILGHSSPLNWPNIKYDWVFSRISELEENDEIFLYFNRQKFTFRVKNKIFLEKGGELPKDLTGSRNTLILISCWPPGKDLRRIAVVAQSE
jgi:LPXTG-site transpeptidase (sortase) family protein